MMPWRRGALALALVVVATACARLRPHAPASPATQQLASALVALDSGRYAPATATLATLARQYPGQQVGRQALLVEAAAALDPRNPQRQLDAGAQLLATYLRGSSVTDWTQPQAETLYLMSLEVGAASARAEQAEAEAAQARAEASRAARRALPQLPGAPLTARISDLQAERDRLAARVKDLESAAAGLQRQLADSAQELKRIRRTLRP